MLVFEVTYEDSRDSKDVKLVHEFVTADSFLTVVKEFIIFCEQYEFDLKGVREVLTIVRQLDKAAS